jgi:hypothetical protein
LSSIALSTLGAAIKGVTGFSSQEKGGFADRYRTFNLAYVNNTLLQRGYFTVGLLDGIPQNILFFFVSDGVFCFFCSAAWILLTPNSKYANTLIGLD